MNDIPWYAKAFFFMAGTTTGIFAALLLYIPTIDMNGGS